MVAISVYKGNLHRAADSPRQWVMPARKISLKDFKTLLNRRSRALQQPTTSNPQQPRSTADADALQPPPPEDDDSLDDKEKRKKEVEDKLQILKERKHKLVQVLKQILNAEEELRRRSNVQGITGRPLQVDVTNDSGSISRHVTPRPGSEGADADDVSTHNVHSRHMARMSSMSPSSESLPRRAPFSMVPNSSRGIVASSPSRFAPTSNGQASVSVTGTNYVASSPSPSPSPSPAGSGGTSVFRDAPIASPWD
ncbi:uncharacterized protein LOC143578253 [Bidens hawaiensis]|uniref:uncharacterized protein LOC143578253 n=1 Tax=Bidens hawaiensis TaxID=980011 RepID=UPI00404A6EB1